VAPGAEIRLRAPGAGGFGDPTRREPARLRDDVLNGYVSPAAAAVEYGHRDADALACPHCRGGAA